MPAHMPRPEADLFADRMPKDLIEVNRGDEVIAVILPVTHGSKAVLEIYRRAARDAQRLFETADLEEENLIAEVEESRRAERRRG